MGTRDRIAENAFERRVKRYAGYGHCGTCNALPNMPCRDRGLAGSKVVIDRPHLSRQKVEGKP